MPVAEEAVQLSLLELNEELLFSGVPTPLSALAQGQYSTELASLTGAAMQSIKF